MALIQKSTGLDPYDNTEAQATFALEQDAEKESCKIILKLPVLRSILFSVRLLAD